MRKKLTEEEKKIKIQLHLNEELNIMLEDYLNETGVNKSKFITQLIEEYLKNKK
jgi:metal-responsive CopG/Arc/MetJ family transcriptional regulator